MSKTRSSGKGKWAAMDKRIRARRSYWNETERKEIETEMGKLPDLAENAEFIEVVQPALAVARTEEDGATAGGETEDRAEQRAANPSGG